MWDILKNMAAGRAGQMFGDNLIPGGASGGALLPLIAMLFNRKKPQPENGGGLPAWSTFEMMNNGGAAPPNYGANAPVAYGDVSRNFSNPYDMNMGGMGDQDYARNMLNQW